MAKKIKRLIGITVMFLILMPQGHDIHSQENNNVLNISMEGFSYQEESQVLTLKMSVLNHFNNPVTGLKEKDVGIHIGGQLQREFIAFEEGVDPDQAIALVLCLDTSRSLIVPDFQYMLDSTGKFIQNLGNNNLFTVISFNDTASVDVNFSSSKNETQRIIGNLKMGGNTTVLYDAVHKALRLIGDNKKLAARKVIVIFSDGVDNNSVVTLNDIAVEIRNAKIPVYTIGFSKADNPETVTLKNLKRLSLISSGTYQYAPHIADLKNIFNLISNQLKMIYTIKMKVNKELFTDGGQELKVSFNYQSKSHHYRALLSEISGFVPVKTPSLPWWIFASGGFLVIFLFTGLIIIKKKKKRRILEDRKKQEERERQKQIEEQKSKCPSCGRKILPQWGKCVCRMGAVPDTVGPEFETIKGWGLLVIKTQKDKGRKFKLAGERIFIGADPGADVCIDHPTVSANHCRIDLVDDRAVVFDLSTYGTRINNRKIKKQVLNDGSELQLGDVKIAYVATS